MRENYLAGGYGYGHAKKELFGVILERFALEREKYNFFMENSTELERLLAKGEEKARLVAEQTMQQVREKLGFND